MVDEQVRERVLEAADRLYYGRGIQSVGMDELRRASGVSLKGLYGLFPSKAAIVLEVLDRRHALWTDGVTERVAGATTPRDKLLAIYDFLADWFLDDTFRGCGFINAFAELGSISPAGALPEDVMMLGFSPDAVARIRRWLPSSPSWPRVRRPRRRSRVPERPPVMRVARPASSSMPRCQRDARRDHASRRLESA
jgi:AcrR family transcriptional regulator